MIMRNAVQVERAPMAMAMGCKAFSYLESSCAHDIKLCLWPFSQVSSSFKTPTPMRPSVRTPVFRVTPSSVTQKTTEEGLETDLHSQSPSKTAQNGLPLELQLETAAQDGFPASQNSSFPVQVREKQEAQLLGGFPGAKGAMVKPLTSEELAYFPEGLLLEKKTSIERLDWVTLVPNYMLPKGDRLVLQHNREDVILFWFKDKIYALENRSPAASTFIDGFSNAVITQEGLIVCPYTRSTFDITTGAVIDWFPDQPLIRLITPCISDLTVYAVKASPDHIFIHRKPLLVGGYYPLAEFTGNRISTDPNYEKPLIFDDLETLEFGFTADNEITNGRAAMLGFFTLVMFEMTTGEGFLKAFGFLDFLYKYLPGFPVLKY